MLKPSQLEENWGKDLEKREVFFVKSCNQCFGRLDEVIASYGVQLAWACMSAKCPNFALYQVPAEDLPTPKKKKKVVK